MKLSFTTLGCPTWDLDQICRTGARCGYDGVDFRGYLDTLDITTLPAFTTHAVATRRRLEDAGLVVSGISSSICACKPEARAANIEEARRTIDAARGLGAGFVRVFGGGDIERHSRDELARIGCETLEAILALPGADRVCWAIETHDRWIKGRDCRLLVDAVSHPAFGVLWDIGHTSRVGGETPAETWAAIGPRVRYCHVKDAIHDPRHPQAMKDGWRYVLPGAGQLPLGESIQLLRSDRYDGWLAFEQEKRWLPELAEPEVAFPAFTRWARSIL